MPHRVLVVGADPHALANDGKALASAGYLVTCTSSFQEAKRRLLLAPPDLLMTDVRLGAYNGLHLVYRMRLGNCDTPAILRNEAPDVVLEHDAQLADALYLVRPVDTSMLLEAVRDLLASRPANPVTAAARKWQRRRAGISATLDDDDTQAIVVDLSYGGFRLEIPEPQSEWLDHDIQVNVPHLGSIPARVVWTRTAGAGPSWCGVEIVDDEIIDAWRGYVDSLRRPS
jgi:DNA-binding response OmpR family regulator